MICVTCGKALTAAQEKRLSQPWHRARKTRGPFCSVRCKSRDASEQMGGKIALDNRPPPKTLGVWQIDPRAPCPICTGNPFPGKLAPGGCPECGSKACPAVRGAYREICRQCLWIAGLHESKPRKRA